MTQRIVDLDEFLALTCPIVDVRAPVEYAKWHIPGAINIPLLEDVDRHDVGLCYRRNGHEAAVQLGLERVGPRLAILAAKGRALAKHESGEKQIAVYCQRGGQRSGSMAWLWSQLGIQTHRLQGGYKGFRQWVPSILSQKRNMLVLAGETGVGKTDVLHALEATGETILDLEGLAHHKGSAFGTIGEKPQPSQMHFENKLAMHLKDFNPIQTIWVEAESRRIGNCQVPSGLWDSMFEAQRVYVHRSVDERIQRLSIDYQEASTAELERALSGIQRRLGAKEYQAAMAALKQEDRRTVVSIVLEYYDRWYEKYHTEHAEQIIQELDVTGCSEEEVAILLKRIKDENSGVIE